MTADRNDVTDQMLEQATAWFHDLADRPDDRDLRRDFEAWHAADPAHARAWDLTQKAWDLSGATAPVDRKPRRPARHGLPHKAGISGLALAACLALFIAGQHLTLHLQADHITAAGEAQSVMLEDGTRVQLAPGSAIKARFTDSGRDLNLIRGEAFFQVAKDADRPFAVAAGGYAVTVTGTAFDVGLTERTLAVAVEHGSVRVAGAVAEGLELAGGERIAIDRRAGDVTRAKVDPRDVAAWRDGTLIVQGRPFADVVQAIRRHSTGAIVIAMAGLDERRVTGVFDLTDPARALKALAEPFGGVVRRAGPYLVTVTGF